MGFKFISLTSGTGNKKYKAVVLNKTTVYKISMRDKTFNQPIPTYQ